MEFSEKEELQGEFPLSDAIDVAILMHRDAHFGGSFDVMIDYYEKRGKGTALAFNVERIRALQLIEQSAKTNLAASMLSGAEAERVKKALDAYKNLRALYENSSKEGRIPKLVADLILSEEPYPAKEIEALVNEKGAAVSALMDLLRAEDFYDPLFPGYGLAPSLAAKALGLIGDKRAVIGLFESVGEFDFFSEDIALEALRLIGEPAKEFLLRVLHAKPITSDNERACLALEKFADDPEVSEACFAILKELDLKAFPVFATYLALACQGLADKKKQEEFLQIAKHSNTPKSLSQDMHAIAKGWD